MKFTHYHYNKDLKEFARELRSETVSKAEKRIWKALLSRKQMKGYRFLRQRPIDHFIVDFFCPELLLIVEIDGNSHYRKAEYDSYRQQKLKDLGYTVIRFSEGLVMQNLGFVHEQLSYSIHCLATSAKDTPVKKNQLVLIKKMLIKGMPPPFVPPQGGKIPNPTSKLNSM